jgi:hypothetical protein
VNIDWRVKENVRAKSRIMVKLIGIFITATALLLGGLAAAVQVHNQGKLRE